MANDRISLLGEVFSADEPLEGFTTSTIHGFKQFRKTRKRVLKEAGRKKGGKRSAREKTNQVREIIKHEEQHFHADPQKRGQLLCVISKTRKSGLGTYAPIGYRDDNSLKRIALGPTNSAHTQLSETDLKQARKFSHGNDGRLFGRIRKR